MFHILIWGPWSFVWGS